MHYYVKEVKNTTRFKSDSIGVFSASRIFDLKSNKPKGFIVDVLEDIRKNKNESVYDLYYIEDENIYLALQRISDEKGRYHYLIMSPNSLKFYVKYNTFKSTLKLTKMIVQVKKAKVYTPNDKYIVFDKDGGFMQDINENEEKLNKFELMQNIKTFTEDKNRKINDIIDSSIEITQYYYKIGRFIVHKYIVEKYRTECFYKKFNIRNYISTSKRKLLKRDKIYDLYKNRCRFILSEDERNISFCEMLISKKGKVKNVNSQELYKNNFVDKGKEKAVEIFKRMFDRTDGIPFEEFLKQIQIENIFNAFNV